jgi:hypothetical protein
METAGPLFFEITGENVMSDPIIVPNEEREALISRITRQMIIQNEQKKRSQIFDPKRSLAGIRDLAFDALNSLIQGNTGPAIDKLYKQLDLIAGLEDAGE